MARVYASLYEKGLRTKKQIPTKFHKDVKTILAERGIEFK